MAAAPALPAHQPVPLPCAHRAGRVRPGGAGGGRGQHVPGCGLWACQTDCPCPPARQGVLPLRLRAAAFQAMPWHSGCACCALPLVQVCWGSLQLMSLTPGCWTMSPWSACRRAPFPAIWGKLEAFDALQFGVSNCWLWDSTIESMREAGGRQQRECTLPSTCAWLPVPAGHAAGGAAPSPALSPSTAAAAAMEVQLQLRQAPVQRFACRGRSAWPPLCSGHVCSGMHATSYSRQHKFCKHNKDIAVPAAKQLVMVFSHAVPAPAVPAAPAGCQPPPRAMSVQTSWLRSSHPRFVPPIVALAAGLRAPLP